MSSRRARGFSIALSSFVLVLDQLSKVTIQRLFQPGESNPIFTGIFHLTYVQNTGAAFGLLKGQQWVFLVFAALIILWMGLSLHRSSSRGELDWSAALIFSGAIGNLIDRARFGYVIDFLDFRIWPVFNIADSALTIGVAVLLWRSFRTRDEAST